MFGYILPYKDKLSEQSRKQYQAAYCGLCSRLRESSGFFARFLVSYDITFLYTLLSAQEPTPRIVSCFCPVHPLCKRDCVTSTDLLAYCADVTVILAWWKLQDTVQDEGFCRRQAARLLLRLYKKAYRRAAERQPEFCQRVQAQLAELGILEGQNCASMDRVADTFAQLLASCTADAEGVQKRILQQLLYHTGRFLYLLDALDDLSLDVKKGRYNPLRLRYELTDGLLKPADKQEVLETLLCSTYRAYEALQLYEPQSGAELLQNIIQHGMPIAAKGVAAGVFRKKKNRRTL